MIHAKDTPLSVILSAALKGQVEGVRTLFGKSLRTKGVLRLARQHSLAQDDRDRIHEKALNGLLSQ